MYCTTLHLLFGGRGEEKTKPIHPKFAGSLWVCGKVIENRGMGKHTKNHKGLEQTTSQKKREENSSIEGIGGSRGELVSISDGKDAPSLSFSIFLFSQPFIFSSFCSFLDLVFEQEKRGSKPRTERSKKSCQIRK